jgi:four helix bundle protein
MRDTGCGMREGGHVSYRNLEIWQLSRQMVVDIHKLTLQNLPKFEMFEEGAQIRRSMKSVKSNMVEGYGRRRYKQDFIKFLTYAHASCDETIDHLETLFETGSLTDEGLYRSLHERLDQLGGKLNRFIQGVDASHQSVREEQDVYSPEESRIPHPVSRIPFPITT